MFKKICFTSLIALFFLTFSNAKDLHEGHGVQELAQAMPQTFKIKFWKIPDLSNIDFIDNTKDKKVFEYWSFLVDG